MAQSPSTGQNLTMYQGTTRVLQVTISGSDPTAASAIVWKMAPVGSNTPVLTKTLAGSGIAAVDATHFNVYLVPSDTSSLTPGEFTHETRLTDGSSNQDVVTVGTVTLLGSITM